MEYLEVKWKLILDQDAKMYMDSAYNGEIEDILETITESIKDGFYSGLFTVEIE